MSDLASTAPIGVFDSGVGGLSVLRSLTELMPAESYIYVADQAHVPYGPRSLEQVRAFSEAIVRYLLDRRARIAVVACNSASAAALAYLRSEFVGFPFVGMEPAVKPAAETTHSGVVGVLATPATFQGALYASVVERFASGVKVLKDTCPGLVEQIEAGNLEGEETRRILERALRPMMAEGIDTVVLACTHFPFVIPMIQEIAGPAVRVIDPAPAVARQTRRLLEYREVQTMPTVEPSVEYFTSGAPGQFRSALARLLKINGRVDQLEWHGDHAVAEAMPTSTGHSSGPGTSMG